MQASNSRPYTSKSRNSPYEPLQHLVTQLLPPFCEYSTLFFCVLILHTVVFPKCGFQLPGEALIRGICYGKHIHTILFQSVAELPVCVCGGGKCGEINIKFIISVLLLFCCFQDAKVRRFIENPNTIIVVFQIPQ